MNAGNEITTTLKKTFLNSEAMMKSKPVNYVLIILGVALFVSFICVKNNPQICNSISTLTLLSISAIIGAIFILIGLINLTAIFNRKELRDKNQPE